MRTVDFGEVEYGGEICGARAYVTYVLHPRSFSYKDGLKRRRGTYSRESG